VPAECACRLLLRDGALSALVIILLILAAFAAVGTVCATIALAVGLLCLRLRPTSTGRTARTDGMRPISTLSITAAIEIRMTY
jgi:hypothetical protein